MPPSRNPSPAVPGPTPLGAASRYLGAMLALNLVWETLQLPLYTLWSKGSVGAKIYAVAHCTGGDLLIAASSLGLAWLAFGRRQWPHTSRTSVAVVTIVLGLAYTVYSEWLNVAVRGAWAYSDLMPLIPLGFFSLGLSPVIQWLLVPALSFVWAGR